MLADEIARKINPAPQLVQVGCRRDPPDCDLSITLMKRVMYLMLRGLPM